jgi:A/G-specific adenine glycosylase
LIPPEVHDALIDWYLEHQRDLPWRETRDPYRILVSEVMLQQTQAERVVPKYHEFLERFPTMSALADASASEVIRAWAGLGYNRRALNLQRACQAAMERFGGEMPQAVEDLLSLPGVGPYTAGAIACFAFEQDVGFVDTNIRRVLHRIALGPDIPNLLIDAKGIAELARVSVPSRRGYLWNQALMELGATVCRARVTDCAVCPVSAWCAAQGHMEAAFREAAGVVRVRQQPFAETSRYFRGRIIDLLRQAPDDGLTARALAIEIDEGRDPGEPAWTLNYLDGLLRDGLVVSSAPSLREDSPIYDGNADPDPERFRLPD